MPTTQEYENEPPVSIGEAARIAGVSISTLRRWEKEGTITPLRTPGGQRRYTIATLKRLLTPPADCTSATRSALADRMKVAS